MSNIYVYDMNPTLVLNKKNINNNKIYIYKNISNTQIQSN